MTSPTHLPKRRLGATGPTVSAIGLGCMGMSPDLYGAADHDESIATIHAALDAARTATTSRSASSSAPSATPAACGSATTPARRR